MKKLFVILIALAVLVGTSSSVYAHSGRTDKNGGHNCSAKSKQKGLCTGYHYHKKKK
ncbi:YHYH domain-containing protein [Cohnella yongneupensis]|uniref:YHYH domain-containing protein n=1 Tax=Cohnella yongneupensis TaxID=425006 RepID=A0ABW0QXN4_9BACL